MWFCRGSAESYDYYVDVTPAPHLVTSSSTITVTCYEDQTLRVAIPSDVVWARVHQGWSKKLPDQSHAYICTANDVGSIIEVEVTGRHPHSQQRNSIVIRFGPVAVDPLLRPIIERSLNNSVESYIVAITSGSKTKEYIIHISDMDIEIKDPRTGSNIKSTYTALQPQFIENVTDPTSTILIIPKENEADYSKYFGIVPSDKGMSIKIRFQSRSVRDSFVLTRKAFVAKRELRLINIIQNSLNSSVSNQNSVDLLVEMSTIKSFNEFLLKKKEMYRNEVQLLQEEIENVKNIYQGLLKQKGQQKPPEKPKFDPVLSLLDSSDTQSKRFDFGQSEIFHTLEALDKPSLAVIKQDSQLRHNLSQIKQTTENVLYSQVYPFNPKISANISEEQICIKREIIIQRNSSISEKSSADPQSILDSSPIHTNRDESVPNLVAIQNYNKQQLYSAWQQEAHKNFILQSRILQLEKTISESKIKQRSSSQEEPVMVKQKSQLAQEIKEKDGIIQLLNAENANLKLLFDTSASLKQAYKSRCQMLNSSIPLPMPGLQSQQEFQQKLKPFAFESDKLLRESQHLNGLLRDAFGHQIEHKHS